MKRFKLRPGDRVRMTDSYMKSVSADHVDEFGNCVGVVEGLTNFGTFQGPEVDVRWMPSRLRYAYHPDDLELVEGDG